MPSVLMDNHQKFNKLVFILRLSNPIPIRRRFRRIRKLLDSNINYAQAINKPYRGLFRVFVASSFSLETRITLISSIDLTVSLI